MDKQVPKLAKIEFTWNWIKDKRIYLTEIPFSQDYHLMVVDEEDDICGLWLLEAVR
jgi:hypothetical protein